MLTKQETQSGRGAWENGRVREAGGLLGHMAHSAWLYGVTFRLVSGQPL